MRGSFAALLFALALALGVTPSQAADDVVVDVKYGDAARLQALADRFQHLDVDRRKATARTVATPDDVTALREAGYAVTVDRAATARLLEATAGIDDKSIANYACYRTVEETQASMRALATTYPTLARVVDIGPSWAKSRNASSGYTMQALVLGNSATDAALSDKAAMVVTSAIHAREYTTAELMTRFAEGLVAGYGVEDEATWLLDNFRFHFVLQANPDGRKRAESGVLWRKNVNNSNGSCSSTTYGVDLNRNFPFHWDNGGSAASSCGETYRGPTSASEPETRNLVRYVAGTPGTDGVYRGGVLPDRRDDAVTAAAAADYRGLYVDVHSFGNLVMWPWGDTGLAPANRDALRALGRRFTWHNHYKPQQGIQLYRTSGTTADTFYGLLGTPAYTFEVGYEFFQECTPFEQYVLPLNVAALRFAARTLDAPYELGNGPVAAEVRATPASVAAGDSVVIEAVLDDERYEDAPLYEGDEYYVPEPVHALVSAAAYVDAAPWHPAAVAVPAAASDGAFDAPRENVRVVLDTSGLAPGVHTVYVQGRDASGARGAPDAVRFTVTAGAPIAPQSGWYWNAAEPGRGFFVERNGEGRAFVATFHYGDDGAATWFSGQGAFAAGMLASPITLFAGGQTLTGPYAAPASQASPGAFGLRYTSATNGELTWPAGTVALTRFPFAASGAVEAPRPGAPESGWWWNAQEPGRGFAIEFQGDAIFVAGFMYADDGRATWYVTTGPIESGTQSPPTRYAGTWLAFRDGQAPGAPHRAPTRAPDAGSVTIEFDDARHARMTLPDGRVIALERFGF